MLLRIHHKIVGLLALVVILVAAGMAVMQNARIRDLDELQRDAARDWVTLTDKILLLQGRVLQDFAYDYSYWDEMVDFVRTRDPAWAAPNLDEPVNMRNLDVAWVYTADCAGVYVTRSAQNGPLQEAPLPSEQLCKLLRANPFRHFFTSAANGLLLEIRTAPIQPGKDNQRRSPPQGYLLAGQLWDSAYLDELAGLTGGMAGLLPADTGGKEETLPYQEGVATFTRTLPNAEEQPAAILRIQRQLSANRLIQESLERSHFLFVGFNLILLGLLFLALFHWVDRPLQRLSRSLRLQNSTLINSLSSRRDEFGQLACLVQNFFQQQQQLTLEIRERQQQEQALRESETRYHTLFEAAGDGILLVRNGVFVDCNSRALELFRCDRAQLLGKTPAIFSPPLQPGGQPSARLAQECFHAALTTREPQRFEWLHQRSDGSLFTAEKTLNWLELSGEPYVQVIVRDISERKRIEQTLRLYLRALEQSANTVIITNANGLIEYVNPKFAETTGYSCEEVIGANPRILKSGEMSPEDYERLWHAIANGGAWHGEFHNRRKNGTLYWESASIAPIRDEHGVITHFVAIKEDITQRKAAEQALHESELRYRHIFSAVGDALFLFDRQDGRILDANQAAGKLYGYTREELLALHDVDLAAPVEVHAAPPRLLSQRNVDRLHRRKDGTLFPVSVSVRHFSHQGRDIAVAAVRDMTAQKLAERKIIRLSHFYAALSRASATIMRCADSQELFQQVCRVIVEFEPVALVWIGLADFEAGWFVPVAHAGVAPNYQRYLLNPRIAIDPSQMESHGPTGKAICSGQPVICNDFLGDPDNQPWYDAVYHLGIRSAAAFPLRRNGGVVACLSVYAAELNFFDADVSELLTLMAGELSFALDLFDRETQRKAAEERIRHLADHDRLTGLPNRALLLDRLTQALHAAQRKQRLVGVLFIDLDHFKVINDSLGHDVGDQLLQAVTQRLRGGIRAEDTLARQGGDEFILVLPDIGEPDAAGQVARHLLHILSAPFTIHPHVLHINASIGISIYPVDAADSDTLIRFADSAMYQAKEAGRAGYAFFTAELNVRVSERFALSNEIRQGLEREEFVLHYQPQFELATGRLIGTEALIRWRHPSRGLIPPTHFIPVAEDTGLIGPLGEWIVHTACAQNRRWQEAGLPAWPIAVNLSARQWLQPDLEERLLRVLETTGLAPNLLELEITEGVLMRDAEKVINVMRRLQDRGVRFAIDDFGMGYSSLGHLRRFPLNRLKIDLSFVRDVTTGPDDAAIVSAIIQIGRSLHLTVIAEGVETVEQLEFLRNHGCDEAQGYYLSRPLTAEDFAERFGTGRLAPPGFG